MSEKLQSPGMRVLETLESEGFCFGITKLSALFHDTEGVCAHIASIIERETGVTAALEILKESMSAEVIENCPLEEAVAVLVSQRDNARNCEEVYKKKAEQADALAEALEGTISPKLSPDQVRELVVATLAAYRKAP